MWGPSATRPSIPRFPNGRSVHHDRSRKGLRPTRRRVVAKKKPSALEALARLNDERAQLENRGAELKRAAALELGMIVLDAGGGAIGPAKLKELVARIVAAGADVSLQRLASSSEVLSSTGEPKRPGGEPAEVQRG
nr:DUF6437 family protein [Sphingomonas sp. ID1715]